MNQTSLEPTNSAILESDQSRAAEFSPPTQHHTAVRLEHHRTLEFLRSVLPARGEVSSVLNVLGLRSS